jgi:hypothetical protein
MVASGEAAGIDQAARPVGRFWGDHRGTVHCIRVSPLVKTIKSGVGHGSGSNFIHLGK